MSDAISIAVPYLKENGCGIANITDLLHQLIKSGVCVYIGSNSNWKFIRCCCSVWKSS